MSDAVAHDSDFLAEEVRRYHHFITLALWLAAITGAEIVLIFVPFPMAVILTLLSLMSAVKFFAVILWFMHLIYDHKLLFWVFMCGMVLAFATFAAVLNLFSADRIDTKWFS
jgi:cytochrome c oxidase subunit 4